MFYSCTCLVVMLLGREHQEYFHHNLSFYKNKLAIPVRSSGEVIKFKQMGSAVRERDDRTGF